MDWIRFIKELKKIYEGMSVNLVQVAKAANIQSHILQDVFSNGKTMTFYVLKKILWHIQRVNKDTATQVFTLLLDCGFNPKTVRTYCRKLKVAQPEKLKDMLDYRRKKKKDAVVEEIVKEKVIFEKSLLVRRKEYKQFLACNYADGTE